MTNAISPEDLLGQLPLGVCTLDASGKVTYANDTFARIAGQTGAELQGSDSTAWFGQLNGDSSPRVVKLNGTEGVAFPQSLGDGGHTVAVVPKQGVEAAVGAASSQSLDRIHQLLDRVERMSSAPPAQWEPGQSRDLSDSPLLAQLSRREREIVTALVAARPVKQIAANLKISPHTVRNHLKSSFRKLNVGSQVELVAKLTQGPAMVAAENLA